MKEDKMKLTQKMKMTQKWRWLKIDDDSKNYETYNNEQKEQVFASSSKF